MWIFDVAALGAAFCVALSNLIAPSAIRDFGPVVFNCWRLSAAFKSGFHQRRPTVEHTDIDARPLRIMRAFVESRNDPDRGKKCGSKVAEARPHLRGRSIRPAREAHPSAHRLHHHIVAG